MLTELSISDFAIIDELKLQLAPGLNVLTGETGAGKSIIIDAVDLLLGSRADTSVVRTGSEIALVEGAFHLDPAVQQQINPILEREGLEGEAPDTLLLAREVRAAGRSYARVNGRVVSQSLLQEICQPLIDIHGQTEHLSLLRVPTHLRLLDRYGGLDEQRRALSQRVKQLKDLRRQLEALRRDEQQTARRIDQLTYQVEEIEAARLQPEEEETLRGERTRLANAERLSQLAGEVGLLLYEGSEEQASAVDLLDQAIQALSELAAIDPSLDEPRQLTETLTIQLKDLTRSVRQYGEDVEFNPQRLTEVEDRLALLHTLKRKYGQTIEEILAFGERAQAELDRIGHSEEDIERLSAQEEALRQDIGQAAETLSQQRQEAAQQLAAEVERELADLNMSGARFAVDISWNDEPGGVYVGERTLAFNETGIDRVEFLIAPNPGEGLSPMVKIASGGETSRLMLALKTVLSTADETPTLIFDEIDQGIGGRIGAVIGRKLRQIARTRDQQRQVLCVTHLPQIAGFADTHFKVQKHLVQDRTATSVRVLDEAEQIEELAAMLGTVSEGTRRSAQEILAEAAAQRLSDG
jgi:DNA repair protein RecN (Recombination protein N)